MKNLSKRFISVFIVLTLILSLFAIDSFAATDAIVATTKSSDYYQEDTFDVTVSFPEMFKKFATLDLELKYDTTNLEVLKVTLGEGLNQARNTQRGTDVFASNYDNPGSLEWILASSRNYEIVGDFAIVTFKVKESANNGKTPITLNIKEAFGSDHNDTSPYITVKNAEINIIRNILADMKFIYNYLKMECTITQYNSRSAAEIVIPSKFNGCTIVAIGEQAFANHTEITSIELPDTVTTIESGAFSGCSSLKELKLPETLKTIDDEAFKNCGNLTSFVAPLYLETLGDSAFEGCYRLESAELNSKLKTIGDAAFDHCPVLNEVRISKFTTSIGKNAFSNSMNTINFISAKGNSTIRQVIDRDGIDATVTDTVNINNATLVPLETQQYHSGGITPDVDLTYKDYKLVNGKDYKIVYFNNYKIGAKATAVVTGIGDYSESMFINFDIDCMHEWNKRVITNPTCTTDGFYSCICIYCSKATRETIPAIGHKESENIKIFVLPTIYKEGESYMLCDVCGDKMGDSIAIPKIYPDVNGDKLVNSTDALEILKYIVELESTIDENDSYRFNADTNGDGALNSLDALDVLNITIEKIVIDKPAAE